MTNCSKCGAVLIAGNNVCPACGEVHAVNNGDSITFDYNAMYNIQPAEAPVIATYTPPPTPPEPVVAVASDTGVLATAPDPNMMPSPDVIPAIDGVALPDQPALLPNEKPSTPISTIIISMLVSIVSLGVLGLMAVTIIDNNKVTTEKVDLSNTEEFMYEGYRFYLPVGLVSEIVDGELLIGDEEATWSAIITLQDGSYNTLVSNRSQLVDYYEGVGFAATEPREQEIHGARFVITHVEINSETVLVAYSRASGMQMFGIILKNEANEYNEDSLKEIGGLLATVKAEDMSVFLPEGFTIDMFRETFKVAE